LGRVYVAKEGIMLKSAALISMGISSLARSKAIVN